LTELYDKIGMSQKTGISFRRRDLVTSSLSLFSAQLITSMNSGVLFKV